MNLFFNAYRKTCYKMFWRELLLRLCTLGDTTAAFVFLFCSLNRFNFDEMVSDSVQVRDPFSSQLTAASLSAPRANVPRRTDPFGAFILSVFFFFFPSNEMTS